MCNVGAIGLGLQAVSMASSYSADKQAEASYASYQSATTAAAMANYVQQSNALNNRYAEEEEATALQKQQTTVSNMKAKATAQASAAASGVTGGTINTLFDGYDRATAMSNFIAARNLSLKGLQYSDELEALKANAISTINLEQQYSSVGVSKLISGVGGIFDSYDNYVTKKEQRAFYKRGSV